MTAKPTKTLRERAEEYATMECLSSAERWVDGAACAAWEAGYLAAVNDSLKLVTEAMNTARNRTWVKKELRALLDETKEGL